MASPDYATFMHDDLPMPEIPRRPGIRPIAVAISDCHVRPGARIWKHAPKPFGDVIYAFRQCAHVVNALSPEFVFLLGDILHANINPADVLGIVADFISQLPQTIPVYYVQGQHDLSSPPWLSLLGSSDKTPRCRPLDSHVLRSEAGVSVLGLDFVRTPYNAFYANLEANHLKEVDVVVTHQAWREVVGPGGNASFQDLGIFSGLKLVLSGDLHMFASFTHSTQVNHYLSTDERLEDPSQQASFRIVFPGTPCITDLNSQPPYGVLILWPDLSVTHVPFFSRSVYKVHLETPEDLERFRSEHPPETLADTHLPGDLQRPILYVSGVPELLLLAKELYEDVSYFRMALKSATFSISIASESKEIIHKEGYDFRVQLLNHLISKNPKYAAVYREFLHVLEKPEDRDIYFRKAISAVLDAEGLHEDSIL